MKYYRADAGRVCEKIDSELQEEQQQRGRKEHNADDRGSGDLAIMRTVIVCFGSFSDDSAISKRWGEEERGRRGV